MLPNWIEEEIEQLGLNPSAHGSERGHWRRLGEVFSLLLLRVGELLKCSHVEEFAKVGLLSRGSAAHALHEPLRLGWIDDMSTTFGPARLIVCRTSDLVGFKIDLRVTWASSLHGMNEGLRKKSTFPPSTFTKVRFSSLNSKTGQITSLNFSNRAFYLPGAVSKAVLLQ
jgi:hypothetical protein